MPNWPSPAMAPASARARHPSPFSRQAKTAKPTHASGHQPNGGSEKARSTPAARPGTLMWPRRGGRGGGKWAMRHRGRPRRSVRVAAHTLSAMEPAQIYGGTARRLSGLLDGLDDSQWSTPVAATPSSTVRDLVAHLAGLTADVQTGQLEGAGTDEWTARQVGEREGRSGADVLAEWRAGAPKIEVLLARGEGSPAFAYD